MALTPARGNQKNLVIIELFEILKGKRKTSNRDHKDRRYYELIDKGLTEFSYAYFVSGMERISSCRELEVSEAKQLFWTDSGLKILFFEKIGFF